MNNLTPSFSLRQQVAGFLCPRQLEVPLQACVYWVWSLNHGSNRDYLFLPRERGFPDIYRRNQPTKSGNISALSLRPLASYPSPLSPLFNGSCLRATTILAAKFSSISAQPLGGCQEGRQIRSHGCRPAEGNKGQDA